ncbi:MAG: hypothetical protein M0Z75_01280 [Nitrospiraceae bacterium]|nr:hypothetical protein [Nitrospiraceae bacterium]
MTTAALAEISPRAQATPEAENDRTEKQMLSKAGNKNLLGNSLLPPDELSSAGRNETPFLKFNSYKRLTLTAHAEIL